MRTIGHNPAEYRRTPGAARGWTWEIAQLANGLLDVERHVVPFDRRLHRQRHRGSRLHCTRYAPHAGWRVVLLPAPDSGAVYVDGRRLVAGDAVILPPASDLELLTHAVGRVYLIAFPGVGAGSRARLRRPRWYSRADGRASSLSEDLRAWLDASMHAMFDSHAHAALQSRLVLWLQSMTCGRAAFWMAKDPRCRGVAWRWSVCGVSSTSTWRNP